MKKAASISALSLAVFLIGNLAHATILVHPSSVFHLVSTQLHSSTISPNQSFDFTFTEVPTVTILSGASTATTASKDLIMNTYNPGTVLYSCNLNAISSQSYTFINMTPSVATTDQSGNVTYVANGTAVFDARSGTRTKDVKCVMNYVNNAPTMAFSGSFVANSLIQDLLNEMSNLVGSLTPSSSTYNIYSSTNDSTQTYTRNTSLFASSVDLTAVPVYSSSSGTDFNGILVTPDILIQANHAHSTGTIYFVDNTNTTVSRTIIGGQNISGTDIYVARLNSAVPGSITPAKVFPSDTFTDKITSTAESYALLPVIFTNQFRTLRIGMMGGNNLGYVNKPTTTSAYLPWYSAVIGGDSGSALMSVVNGGLVALGVWYTSDLSSASYAPPINQYITQINSAITALGSATSLTTVSLSGFPTY